MEDFGILFCGGIFFVINILVLVWAYNDAEERNQNGCLVAILIFLAGIPGIIIWLIVRDNLSSKSTFRSSSVRKCPYCAEYIKKEAVVCRYCGNSLKSSDNNPPPPQKQVCPNCGTICKAHDDFCPSCKASLRDG